MDFMLACASSENIVRIKCPIGILSTTSTVLNDMVMNGYFKRWQETETFKKSWVWWGNLLLSDSGTDRQITVTFKLFHVCLLLMLFELELF